MVKDMLETLVNLPEFSVRVIPDDEDGFEVTAQVPSQCEPAWDDSDQIVGPPDQVMLVTSE
ncbi:MAG: hypothetical protein F4Y47_05550 [Acidobacteriia bacterium]|nr:hypothetical protein [Terriglobia bacterium]